MKMVIGYWDTLPQEGINASVLDVFISGLDTFLEEGL